MKRLLLIPHIKIQNANALSSPYTIGFPAMTAWLGASHALQRSLNQQGFPDVQFISTAVICHRLNLQTYKGVGDFEYSIIGTGNPLDNNGNRPAFIEEGRCHLEISLVLEHNGIRPDIEEAILASITSALHSKLKMAGGDIINFRQPEFAKVENGNDSDLRQVMRKLMPGYVLIERRELMVEAMEQGQDAIDALLEYLKVMHRSEQDDEGNVTWTSKRKTSGWIVPIATGFHGITELGQAKNQRDPYTQHRFAESVITLGEFIMPYRIKSLDDMFWHYHHDPENNLYLCQQNNRINHSH